MKYSHKLIIERFADDLSILNSIAVSLFIKTNNINIENNKLIKSLVMSARSEHYTFIETYEGHFTFEDVIKIFELAIPKDDVTVNGAVYTPDYIKSYIVDKVFSDGVNTINRPISEWMCADISCGCGAFLYTLAKKLKSTTELTYSQIFNNVYGYDICSSSINRARILLSLLAVSDNEDIEEFNFRLYVGNSLTSFINDSMPNNRKDGFDIIVGNPPYVRSKHIDTESKSLLKKWSVSSGNADLYIPFFEIGLSNLNASGILGYITVNSFFKSVNARLLRKYIQEQSLEFEIIDFGQELIFEKKLAYTCLAFLRKSEDGCISYTKQSRDIIKQHNTDLVFERIEYANLDYHKGWLLNRGDILRNISKLEGVGIALGDKYNIKNGLATLANGIYIFRPESEDELFYYHNWNGVTYQIEREVCQDIIKPNVLKREDEIESKLEKIIFPYIDGKIMRESFFMHKYPFAYEYLKDNKEVLDNRDKGKGDYQEWFAFGRTQALFNKGKKLLIPYMSDKSYAVYTDNEDMLIYCGYAIYASCTKDMFVLKKLLESSLFDYYIRHTSKPYSTGYYSYAKNYIKYFGVYDFSDKQKLEIINMSSKQDVDKYLCKLYGINYSSIKQ